MAVFFIHAKPVSVEARSNAAFLRVLRDFLHLSRKEYGYGTALEAHQIAASTIRGTQAVTIGAFWAKCELQTCASQDRS